MSKHRNKLNIRELLTSRDSFYDKAAECKVNGVVINRDPNAYVRAMLQACNGKKKQDPFYVPPEPKQPEVDHEMNRAWDHFVVSGDFDAVRNLRQQRELSNWFMNRWD